MISSTNSSLAPIDDRVDHLRGAATGHVIVEYGDYECPYSRLAYRAIQRLQQELGDRVAFAYRHYPLTDIHPHATGAAAAAEAAAAQGRFWDMHDLLFHRQKALDEKDVRRYAEEIGLDIDLFERDRAGLVVRGRVDRDVESGKASGVRGTPTLFIDGVRHRGSYEVDSLRDKLAK